MSWSDKVMCLDHRVLSQPSMAPKTWQPTVEFSDGGNGFLPRWWATMFGWLIATLPFSILLGTGTGEGHTHRQQGSERG